MAVFFSTEKLTEIYNTIHNCLSFFDNKNDDLSILPDCICIENINHEKFNIYPKEDTYKEFLEDHKTVYNCSSSEIADLEYDIKMNQSFTQKLLDELEEHYYVMRFKYSSNMPGIIDIYNRNRKNILDDYYKFCVDRINSLSK